MSLHYARTELVEAIFDSWRKPADRLRPRKYRVACHQMPDGFIDAVIAAALRRGIERGRCTTWEWDDEEWIHSELHQARIFGLESMVEFDGS